MNNDRITRGYSRSVSSCINIDMNFKDPNYNNLEFSQIRHVNPVRNIGTSDALNTHQHRARSAYARRVNYLTRNCGSGAERVVSIVDQGAVSLVEAINKQCNSISKVNRCVLLCNRNNTRLRPSRIGSGVGRFRPVVGTWTVLDRTGISSKIEPPFGLSPLGLEAPSWLEAPPGLEALLGRIRAGHSRGRRRLRWRNAF